LMYAGLMFPQPMMPIFTLDMDRSYGETSNE